MEGIFLRAFADELLKIGKEEEDKPFWSNILHRAGQATTIYGALTTMAGKALKSPGIMESMVERGHDPEILRQHGHSWRKWGKRSLRIGIPTMIAGRILKEIHKARE